MKSKILFLTNRRSLPYTQQQPKNRKYSNTLASGLSNSIGFVVDMLIKEGYSTKYVQVHDGNNIDKEVHEYKPDIVLIEALWVTPEKLTELTKLYPKVKWIIRIHSEIPFLANEGIAMEWLIEYDKISENVFISANSTRAAHELKSFLEKPIHYLPNYYPVTHSHFHKKEIDSIIHIGCFGAIRPMKNQLMQAIAALKFAEDIDKVLHFHININREETGGNSVLKNLRNLFKNKEHKLIEHPWANHEEFIKIVKTMDLGMQASLSETYNIVTADMVNNYIPVVVSKEIRWTDEDTQVNPNSFEDLVGKLHHIYKHVHDKDFLNRNLHLLEKNSEKSVIEWNNTIEYLSA